EIRHLLARLVDRLFRFPAERMVPAGGVAEVLGEKRHHRLDDTGVDGRRGVIVHVNRKLNGHVPLTAGLKACTTSTYGWCVCSTAARAGAGDGGSAASSAIVQSPSAARMRSRTRHRGSRTLHFANCSHCPSSVEQAVTVTGPS